MPVNIRSVTAPSGGRGERASRMLDDAAGRVDADGAPAARLRIVAQQHGGDAAPAAVRGQQRGQVEIGHDLGVHHQHRPRPNNGRAFAMPPPVPSSSVSTE